MKLLTKIFSVLSFLFYGCAGISFSEFQDADSLGEGHSALTAGFSMGVEGRYQFAVSNKADLGISLWSINVINPVKDDNDIGLKLNWKQLLSAKEDKHKIAFTLSGFIYTSSYTDRGFFDGFEEINEVNYDAWGVTPGVIYSYTFNRKNPEIDWPGNYNSNSKFQWLNPRSIYAGLKINYLSITENVLQLYDSTTLKTSPEIIFPMPFVGITWGEEHLQYYTEFIYLSRNLFPHKDIGPMFYGTMGIKFVFGL